MFVREVILTKRFFDESATIISWKDYLFYYYICAMKPTYQLMSHVFFLFKL